MAEILVEITRQSSQLVMGYRVTKENPDRVVDQYSEVYKYDHELGVYQRALPVIVLDEPLMPWSHSPNHIENDTKLADPGPA